MAALKARGAAEGAVLDPVAVAEDGTKILLDLNHLDESRIIR